MMNMCIRLTLDTNDPTEADRIVTEMMAKPHEGVICWGKHKNNQGCIIQDISEKDKTHGPDRF